MVEIRVTEKAADVNATKRGDEVNSEAKSLSHASANTVDRNDDMTDECRCGVFEPCIDAPNCKRPPTPSRGDLVGELTEIIARGRSLSPALAWQTTLLSRCLDAITTRDAEIARILDALREAWITEMRDGGVHYSCVCDGEWRLGEPEQHAYGCLLGGER